MSGVLHVITDLRPGGAQGMLARIAIANRIANEPRQTVVSLMDEGAYGEVLRAGGVELLCLGMKRGLPSVRALFRLAGILRRSKPDVIMTWLYHADLTGTGASILAGLGVRRIVWNLRCSDMDLARYPRSTRWTVALLARLSRFPAAVAVNSRAGRVHHERLGYRPRRWAELPNGFDLQYWRPDAQDRIDVRAELGLDCKTVAVGMVARVDPMKDHATFLVAAGMLVEAFPDVRFVLIGNDTETLPLPPRLHGKVILLGERKDVNRILRGLDIAVLCSITEGFPNVVGEAMASGLPCVVTDVGDSAEIVAGSGEVVLPRSPDALSAAIARIVGENCDTRRMRGEAARQRIAENFILERVAGLYRDLWHSIGIPPHR